MIYLTRNDVAPLRKVGFALGQGGYDMLDFGSILGGIGAVTSAIWRQRHRDGADSEIGL